MLFQLLGLTIVFLKMTHQSTAPGPDDIHPELERCKIPKIWRKATVIALPKPNKPKDDPKSYRPISLLCIPFKLLERMIHRRINPTLIPATSAWLPLRTISRGPGCSADTGHWVALARRSKFSDTARNPAKQRSISSAVLRSLMSVGNATDKAE